MGSGQRGKEGGEGEVGERAEREGVAAVSGRGDGSSRHLHHQVKQEKTRFTNLIIEAERWM